MIFTNNIDNFIHWSDIFSYDINKFITEVYRIALFRDVDQDGLHFYSSVSHGNIFRKENIVLDITCGREYCDIFSGERFRNDDKVQEITNVFIFFLRDTPSDEEISRFYDVDLQNIVLDIFNSKKSISMNYNLWILRQSLRQVAKLKAHKITSKRLIASARLRKSLAASEYAVMSATPFSGLSDNQERFQLCASHDELIDKDWVSSYNYLKTEIYIYNNIFLPIMGGKNEFRLFLILKQIILKTLCSGKQLVLPEIINELKYKIQFTEILEPINCSSEHNHEILEEPVLGLVTSLALFHRELLLDLFNISHNISDVILKINQLNQLRPVFLTITKIPYPMGGGESYTHDILKITNALGFYNIWVSFSDKYLRPNKYEIKIRTPIYEDVRLPEKSIEDDIKNSIIRFGADIVNSQGIVNNIVESACKDLRIPALIGFHFWSGLIELFNNSNTSILSNADKHRAILPRIATKNIRRFVASKFMNEVYKTVSSSSDIDVISPVPLKINYCPSICQSVPPVTSGYVLQMNITPLKGGEIFYFCASNAPSYIRFVGVQAEPSDDELIVKIKKLSNKNKNVDIFGHSPSHSLYAGAKLVLVPSIVDETFCMVAYEAASLGIPVLSTAAGNLKYLFGDSGVYLPHDKPEIWLEKIIEILGSEEKRANIAKRQREAVTKNYGEVDNYNKLINNIINLKNASPRFNYGIFGTLNEQGLGYQSITYGRLLKQRGFGAYIFSYRPYGDPIMQVSVSHDESSWMDQSAYNSVYHSMNTREEVTVEEIKTFALRNMIGGLIIPEICWSVNWEKWSNVSVSGLHLFSVPNVETVRGGEIAHHGNVVFRNLCPSRAIYNVLESHKLRNISYIGHGYGYKSTEEDFQDRCSRIKASECIKYIHVGGHNAVSRKNTSYVISEFIEAAKYRNDIRLTVIFNCDADDIVVKHPSIQYIVNVVEHKRLINLYRNHDISIQVSSHEGIGLGFYESLSQYVPVISLDVPPHNEVVSESNGWLIPASLKDLHDNDDAVWMKAEPFSGDLTKLLIVIDRDDIVYRMLDIHSSYFDRNSFSALSYRLIKGLLNR